MTRDSGNQPTPTLNGSLSQNALCERRDTFAQARIDHRSLRTNFVPSQLEVREMKEAIEEETRRLEEVQKLCFCLSERIQQRHSIVSALRRVPVEIWEEIFSLLCRERAFSFSFDMDSDTDASHSDPWGADSSGNLLIPKILSSVCSHWRNIINDSSPSLWSFISIMLVRKLHPRIEIPLAAHLEKSKGYPLDLRIVPFPNSDDEADYIKASAEKVFRVVLPHLHRCRVLDFQWSDFEGLLEHVLQTLEFPSELAFTHLTELRFDMDLEVDARHSFWQALSQAPMLKRVWNSDLSSLEALMLPWHQLTSLDVYCNYNPQPLFPVLSECQSLQSLHLNEFQFLTRKEDRELDLLDFASAPPVVLPFLRKITVWIGTFPDDLYPLFSMFAFPSLRELDVICLDVQINLCTRDFLTSFERSALEITHLKLLFSDPLLSEPVGLASIALFLEATVNVTHLDIELSSDKYVLDSSHGLVLNFFLDHLGIGLTNSPILVPKLSHLYLHDDSQQKWDLDLVDSVLEVLESRSSSWSSLVQRDRTDVTISPLSVFHLVYCDRILWRCRKRRCDDLDDVPGSLEMVRKHEDRYGMRCRIAHVTSDVGGAVDKFDPRSWRKSDEQ
ncbi:hypothetical protein L218DRAFT_990194 [Marasmius fiardii PR-910]|nr:hypothetical protein L218DRAFT_990194 [Marasmius fiardii PR-910]